MDFRSVSPGSIAFKKAGQRGAVAATGPGGKVRVQVPECPCFVSVHSPGTYRVELKLPNSPTHDSFAEWIGEVESIADSSRGAWGPGLCKSEALYHNGTVNSMRLLAFSDTLVFDEHGELSADLMTAKKCIALVELAGCWTSGARWGLRWKVVQIKFWTRSEHALPSRDDEACMFDKV